ncbi:DUF4321 domain-containing protein [Paenibacillus flagellatus]|uniref:DUF4321 domain-containing protein n=1 Tax=Paenibacillus flagellatus TaxID=2211139 RepID=A0A2V5JZL1_9BACL|nr:DUF4321 domain-containing protein [Paenibacillus flagellatus]PYI52221.1 DUF4321 domain-containing protein [Paenibacillus flagellatus]
MKKNAFTLVLFLLLGLLAGAIVAQLLEPVSWLGFLTKSAEIKWQPKADLSVVKYDLDILVKLNVISLLGIAAAIWMYRRL